MLSIIILAKNEEALIETCLESVKWADEIIFFDNNSTDKTVQIAKKYTDKIYKFDKLDYAKVKDEAFQKTSGDWILYIDSDERVTAKLREEIKQIMQSSDNSAYAISRVNIILGKEEKYGPFWPDWVIRLVKKEAYNGWFGEVHETLTFKGKLGYTENSFLHLTHRNVDQIILKSLNWANIDARLRLNANHPKMSSWRFLRILKTELLTQGILRRGFFNGTVGTMDAILQTFSLVITYMKLWELQQKPSLQEKYIEIDEKLRKDDFKY